MELFDAGTSETISQCGKSRSVDISHNTVHRYIESDAIEPAYPARHSPSSSDDFAARLSAWLSAESVKSRKQRRTLKLMFLDLKELGYEGSYDRVTAFGRRWEVGQMERVKSASKSTSICSRHCRLPFPLLLTEQRWMQFPIGSGHSCEWLPPFAHAKRSIVLPRRSRCDQMCRS
ncbi:transposase protein [Herbaspirillum rubrisubalbicans M1]|nr:transposase protein [Herbaspirillum rubrisubalbicans M1]